jgi:hypothetical protein
VALEGGAALSRPTPPPPGCLRIVLQILTIAACAGLAVYGLRLYVDDAVGRAMRAEAAQPAPIAAPEVPR